MNTKLKCDISKEDLQFLYDKHHSLVKVAQILGISRRTICAYVKKLGIKSKRGRPYVYPRDEIQRWLTDHPDVKLPKSMYKIADMMGVQYQRVQRYFKNGIRRLRKLADDVTNDQTKSYRSTTGWTFPRKAFKITDMVINRRSLTLRIDAKLKSDGRPVRFLLK